MSTGGAASGTMTKASGASVSEREKSGQPTKMGKMKRDGRGRTRLGLSAGSQLPLLHVLLLLSREPLLHSTSGESNTVEAGDQLLDLNRLELLEKGDEGVSDKEVELLDK